MCRRPALVPEVPMVVLAVVALRRLASRRPTVDARLGRRHRARRRDVPAVYRPPARRRHRRACRDTSRGRRDAVGIPPWLLVGLRLLIWFGGVGALWHRDPGGHRSVWPGPRLGHGSGVGPFAIRVLTVRIAVRLVEALCPGSRRVLVVRAIVASMRLVRAE